MARAGSIHCLTSHWESLRRWTHYNCNCLSIMIWRKNIWHSIINDVLLNTKNELSSICWYKNTSGTMVLMVKDTIDKTNRGEYIVGIGEYIVNIPFLTLIQIRPVIDSASHRKQVKLICKYFIQCLLMWYKVWIFFYKTSRDWHGG